MDIAAQFLFDLPSRHCETEHTIHNCIFFKSIFNACIQHARYTRGRGRGKWEERGGVGGRFWQLAIGFAVGIAFATRHVDSSNAIVATHAHSHTQPCVSLAMQIGDCIKNGGNFSNYFKWQFVSNARAAVAKIQFQFCFWVHFSNLISIFGHGERERGECREQRAERRVQRAETGALCAISRITLLANFQANHI